MSKNLVIVESPAKAKTLGQILGKDYSVKASLGHVRDLPQKELGIDIENDFSPKYVVSRGKTKVVKEIKEAAKSAKAVYLATDPDREGEAISWHLVAAAGLGKKPLKRVVFHEITEEAITDAFKHPRAIDMKLVNAQQARRILDRLVGYKISPLLWKKVRRGLSAGRVQSVAVKLIVDREREILGFVPVEYWSIEAELAKEGKKSPSFRAGLVGLADGDKLELKDKEQTDKLVARLEKASYAVSGVRQEEDCPAAGAAVHHQHPAAGGLAQVQLQRQADHGHRPAALRGPASGQRGPVGLITYMRTDSTNVAASALAETRDYISEKYGNDFLPPTPRRFTKKVKGAQEAHEAIRPTSVRREPEQVKPYLNSAQLKLYTLIWQRMVASQMAAAQIDTTTVDIEATAAKEKYLFRAAISVIAFPGFLTLYQEGKDEDENGEKKSKLPELAKGEKLRLLQLVPEQHFTQPPPRYTEATLIKALEEKGIGRPSTYAPIISLIQERGYVERRNAKLGPTELGTIVSNLLSEHFADIVNVGFTAQMEKKLDQIASGELEWVPMLHEFYSPFQETIAKATKAIPKVSEPTNEICEKCGRPMVIKWGRRGKFMSCSGFPECKNARSIVVTIGVKCPQCKGEMVERKSKKGRTFYGCGNYPKCKFAVWDKPLPKPCPQCGGLLTLSKKGLAKCSQCTYEGEAGEEG